ncbi:MAG: ferredoxin-thioredoxin reductase catalytic domain-containing protein [Chloroflexota bacterium]|nr:ferredoxin-thioredoxin reductase catalytic domain-containing protein [Chloroflexota bacterium]
MAPDDITDEMVDSLYERLRHEAEAGGYHLNPDADFTKDMLRSLLINEARYGYQSCPCRLASGAKEEDIDIVCPCDYRDPDLGEYGSCYCALYVSEGIAKGEKEAGPIPERRPPPQERAKAAITEQAGGIASLPLPVWRCRVCGYLCARDEPPESCPICKAEKERFERFL